MRILLFIFVTLFSIPSFATNYECITGVREVYRGNLDRPISSEDFLVCRPIKPAKKHSKLLLKP